MRALVFDRGATIIEGATIFKGGASMMIRQLSLEWALAKGDPRFAILVEIFTKFGWGRLVGPILIFSLFLFYLKAHPMVENKSKT